MSMPSTTAPGPRGDPATDVACRSDHGCCDALPLSGNRLLELPPPPPPRRVTHLIGSSFLSQNNLVEHASFFLFLRLHRILHPNRLRTAPKGVTCSREQTVLLPSPPTRAFPSPETLAVYGMGVRTDARAEGRGITCRIIHHRRPGQRNAVLDKHKRARTRLGTPADPTQTRTHLWARSRCHPTSPRSKSGHFMSARMTYLSEIIVLCRSVPSPSGIIRSVAALGSRNDPWCRLRDRIVEKYHKRPLPRVVE